MKKAALLFFIALLSLNIAAQDESSQDDNWLETLIRNNQYNEVLQFIAKQEPTPQFRFQEALCHKWLGNYGDAIRILQSLTNEDALNKRYYSELAECYMALSSWKKSADCYEYLTKLDTANVYYELQQGIMLSRLGNYSKALPIYNSLQSKYNLKSVYKYKAECFDKMNMPDSAAHYYAEAWKSNDFDTNSFASYVTLKIKAKDYQTAIEMTDNFIANDTTNLTINRLNALSYYATNFLYSEAAKRFERCYQMGDSSLQVSRGLGMSYYTLDSLNKAYPHLVRAYNYDTTSVNIIFPLADVCHLLQKDEEAAKYYTQLLDQLIPKPSVLSICYKNLAESLVNIGLYDDAITYYQELLRLFTDMTSQMNLYYTIGNICDEKAKKYNDAIFYYGKYRETLLYQLKIDERELSLIEKRIAKTTNPNKELIDKKRNTGHVIDQMKERISNLDTRINELKAISLKEFEESTPIESIYVKRDKTNTDSTKQNLDSIYKKNISFDIQIAE